MDTTEGVEAKDLEKEAWEKGSKVSKNENDYDYLYLYFSISLEINTYFVSSSQFPLVLFTISSKAWSPVHDTYI